MKYPNAFSVISGVAVGIALSSAFVFAWTGPTGTAPANNVSAPINVGTTDQVKNAGLSLNSLLVSGNSSFTGTVGIGTANPAALPAIYSPTVSATLDLRSPFATTQTALYFSDITNGVDWAVYRPQATRNLAFWNPTAGDALTLLQTNGYVGIGTVNPGQRLTVAGTVESTSGGFKFPDGTTQSTAAGAAGGISAITSASIVVANTNTPFTVNCPATYYRTGCSATVAQTIHTDYYYAGPYSYPGIAPANVAPSAGNGCTCTLTPGSGQSSPYGGTSPDQVTVSPTCYVYCAK